MSKNSPRMVYPKGSYALFAGEGQKPLAVLKKMGLGSTYKDLPEIQSSGVDVKVTNCSHTTKSAVVISTGSTTAGNSWVIEGPQPQYIGPDLPQGTIPYVINPNINTNEYGVVVRGIRVYSGQRLFLTSDGRIILDPKEITLEDLEAGDVMELGRFYEEDGKIKFHMGTPKKVYAEPISDEHRFEGV